MTTERYEQSALGGTYKGFSSPAAPAPSVGPDLRKLLIAGVAAAVALGIGMGLWAKPVIRPAETVAMTSAPAPQAASADEQVQIVFNPPPKPAPLKPGPRMEVLPADMAAAAPRARPAQVRIMQSRSDYAEPDEYDARDEMDRAPPEPDDDYRPYPADRPAAPPPSWW
jgi:hypothetical protein